MSEPLEATRDEVDAAADGEASVDWDKSSDDDDADDDADDDDVAIGLPNISVVAAGNVLILAAGTVTVFTPTPADCAVLVFIHKHLGVAVGIKSPVVLSPNDALVYVTK
ncbi:hypothetical protein DTO280E4_149 [Paecilomyces variotii]|nr:hypothetical protein DTO280E4_149 [Paecilomyces variotii]